MFVKTQVRQFMREELSDYTHPDIWEGGEVNLTRLAENAAWEFGFDQWLDDPDHWVWDIALEEADRAEKERYC